MLLKAFVGGVDQAESFYTFPGMADVVVAVDERDNLRLLDHDEISGLNDIDATSKGQDENEGLLPGQAATSQGVDIVVVDNVHKTYLLGIEGVAALRSKPVPRKMSKNYILETTNEIVHLTLISNMQRGFNENKKGRACYAFWNFRRRKVLFRIIEC